MRKQIILAAAISAALSVSAFAAVNQGPAKTGLYIGVNGGMGNVGVGKVTDQDAKEITFSSNSAEHTPMSKDYHFVWGLFAGYQYAIMPNMAIGAQLGYNNNGYSKTKDIKSLHNPIGDEGSVQYNSSDIDLLGTATYYINNQFNVFAKGGVARVTVNVQENDKTTGMKNTSADVVGYEPEAVVGVGYSPIKNVGLTLEYDHIFGNDKANQLNRKDVNKSNAPMGIASVNAVKAGVTYTLPM